MSMFTHALAFMSATMFQARNRHEERGATAVEYGLLVALIAAVIVAVVALLGQNILDGFTSTNNKLDNPTGGATTGS